MRILNFIICDDIRQETSGKHTLVGAYNDLVIHGSQATSVTWPIAIRLGFYCTIASDGGLSKVDRYEFSVIQDGNEIAKVEGRLQPIPQPDIQYLNIVTMMNPLVIPKPVILSFRLRFFNGKDMIDELRPENLKVTAV